MPSIKHVPVDPTLTPLLFTNVAEFAQFAEDGDPRAINGLIYPLAIDGNPENGPEDFRFIMIDPDVVVVETQPNVRIEGTGMSDKAIGELADKMAGEGQISPILGRYFKTPNTESSYGEIQVHLVAGMRRTLAGRLIKQRLAEHAAKLRAAGTPEDQIPPVEFNLTCVMRVVQTEEVARQLTLSENVNREDMSALEKFTIYKIHLDANRGPKGVNVAKAAEDADISRTQMADYDRIDQIYGKVGEEKFTAFFNLGQLNFDAAAQLAKLEQADRIARLTAAEALVSQKILSKAQKAAAKAAADVLTLPQVTQLTPEQQQEIAANAAALATQNVHAQAQQLTPGKAGIGTITTAVLNEAAQGLPTAAPRKLGMAEFIKILESEISPALATPMLVEWKNMLVNRLTGILGPEADALIWQTFYNKICPQHKVEQVLKPATPAAPVVPARPGAKANGAATPNPPPAPVAAPAGVPVAPAPPVAPRRPGK